MTGRFFNGGTGVVLPVRFFASAGGITADRAPSPKEILAAYKITGGTADRREIAPAAGTALCVSGHLRSAIFTKKMRTLGGALF